MINKIYFDYIDISKQVDLLTEMINNSGKKYNNIVTLAKGGYIISRMLAENLNIKRIYSIGISLYEGSVKGNKPHIYQTLTKKFDSTDKILLVDDISDFGDSLLTALVELKKFNVKNIDICTLHFKPHSQVIPTYYAQIINDQTWCVYPWEK